MCSFSPENKVWKGQGNQKPLSLLLSAVFHTQIKEPNSYHVQACIDRSFSTSKGKRDWDIPLDEVQLKPKLLKFGVAIS